MYVDVSVASEVDIRIIYCLVLAIISKMIWALLHSIFTPILQLKVFFFFESRVKMTFLGNQFVILFKNINSSTR